MASNIFARNISVWQLKDTRGTLKYQVYIHSASVKCSKEWNIHLYTKSKMAVDIESIQCQLKNLRSIFFLAVFRESPKKNRKPSENTTDMHIRENKFEVFTPVF